MRPGYERPEPTASIEESPEVTPVQTPEPKTGIVKGMIRHIPFVGKHLVGSGKEETPTPVPSYEKPSGEKDLDEPEYRGYSTPIPRTQDQIDAPEGEPLLRPAAPGSAVTPGAAGMESRRPAIERGGAAPAEGVHVNLAPARSGIEVAPAGDVDSGSGVSTLTVKSGSADSGTSDKLEQAATPAENNTGSPPIATPEITPLPQFVPPVKKPAVSGEATSLDEKPSVSSVPAPEPAADAPASALATPATTVATSSPDDTSVTVQETDLGMPNPAYEQNDVILSDFKAAIQKARQNDFDAAAAMMREYASNHPSSGLAPRALFLSVIFEKNNAKAEASRKQLAERFPDSHYVNEARERRPKAVVATQTAAGDSGVSITLAQETPALSISEMESQLTLNVGNPVREPLLRKQLGEAYIEQKDYDRALEILKPAVDMSKGQSIEPEILLLISECYVQKKDVQKAAAILMDVADRFPDAARNPRAAWNIGLVYEEAGKYQKARAIYGDLRRRWPDTKEAGWAGDRMNDIARLSD